MERWIFHTKLIAGKIIDRHSSERSEVKTMTMTIEIIQFEINNNLIKVQKKVQCLICVRP